MAINECLYAYTSLSGVMKQGVYLNMNLLPYGSGLWVQEK